jgi:hypothetical protein
MANERNQHTTHPRKKARRVRALARFSLDTRKLDSAPYLANKEREFIALGGPSEQFKSVPHRIPTHMRNVA